MKVHFSNVNFSSNSGPNSFAARLANELTILGHHIVSEKESYETMLVFIEPSSRPKSSTRIIHRLDGIWFKPDQFHSHNKLIKWTYDNCDEVIWQSEFDKKMTEHHWGSRKGEVIHNGINIKKYDIASDIVQCIRDSYENMFVCSSSWHRQKRLKENIDLFFKLKEVYPSSCLVIMGENSGYPVAHKDIFYMGAVSHDTCLEVFSASDWMIHLAWLDHCPNVVVESLSQHCPVICTDSGGTLEIVQNNGIVIPESTPYKFELTDYDRPYKLHIPTLELPEIEVDNSYLDIKRVAQKYIRVMERQ
jgi:glycosyltransferase involved in cell wall biosynthesis